MINFLNISLLTIPFHLILSTNNFFFYYYYYSKLIVSNAFNFPRWKFLQISILPKIFIVRSSLTSQTLFRNEMNPRNGTTNEGSKLQTCRSFFKATRVVAIFGGVYSLERGGRGVYRPSEKFRNRSGGADTR